MVVTDVGQAVPKHPNIKLPKNATPPIFPESKHDDLLDYLIQRLNSDKTNRELRARRYKDIDKSVSTWQRLSMEDGNRKENQRATGKGQAISINLPIQHTHMDDMVSFFCGVYAPNAGSFYEEPNDSKDDSKQRTEAIKTMNGDAKKNKYFKNLMRAMRSLFKYNIGGFLVEWLPLSDEAEPNEGSNHITSMDMYNFFWDSSVDDPADIPKKAEWAAWADRVNRMTLIKAEQAGEYHGVARIIADPTIPSNGGNVASYYLYPPNHAGLALDGSDDVKTKGTRANWESYGVGLPGEGVTNLENSHERVQMYCWLNPKDFGLKPTSAAVSKDGYYLFKFVILDGKRVVQASLVQLDDETPTPDYPPRIPIFVGFLNQDDMGLAQRSIAELLGPFQTYGSFLLNSHVAGSRAAVYGGITGYDPTMFDMANIPEGESAVRVPSKSPGRDVRSGMHTLNSNPDTGQAMDDLSKLMALIDKFFPGQALPSQIASMDRAVTQQVSAVLQGVNRRLHMLVRTMDDDILAPTRFEQVLNMIRNGKGDFSGMTETAIMNFIGSGLAQLNREVAAAAFQQLIFAIIQNPNASQEYDVVGMMDEWGNMQNIDMNLERFRRTPPPGVTPSGAEGGGPPAPGAPQQPA